jgi:DNA-binding CsgD family transcriptional regulator
LEQITIKGSELEGLDIPIFIKNIEGVYIYCNKAFVDFLEIQRADILGHTAYDIAPRRLADTYVAADKQLFCAATQQSYVAPVERGGTKTSANFKKSVFYTPNGDLAGFVGAITARGDGRKRASYAAKQLTPREDDVMSFLIQGQSTKAIAGSLGISPHTVADHLKKIYIKLGVNSKNEALLKALSLSGAL